MLRLVTRPTDLGIYYIKIQYIELSNDLTFARKTATNQKDEFAEPNNMAN